MSIEALPKYQKYISNFEGYNVKFSPFENNKVACVFSQYFGMIGNGRLSVFNTNNFGVIEEAFRFNTNDSLFDLCWSEANENQIATVGGDGSIKVWDVAHKLPLVNFKEHVGEGYGIAWSHLSTNLIISGGMDSTVKMYDLNKPSLVLNLAEHRSVVYNVTWHPVMGNLFASVSGDQTLKIWDMKVGKSIKTIRASNSDVLCCDFNKYQNIIATSGANGEVNIYDLRGVGDAPMVKLNGHILSAKKCMFSPFFDSILATAGYDMNVFIWDIKKNTVVNTFKHHREFVMGLDFSQKDNKKIATASWDRTLWVYRWDESLLV